MDIDLSKVDDQYCSTCGTQRIKYVGKILGTPAVLFRDNCSCVSGTRKMGKSDAQRFNELQIPFWKMMGAKPKPKDIALERYLKRRGMTYGDYRRERDYRMARNQSAFKEFTDHYKKYGRQNAPDLSFRKEN